MDEIDQLRILSEEKENDWKLVVQKRMQILENDNLMKKEKLEDNEEKMKKLKEDFKYNLKLLQERDDDLNRYEKMLAGLKGELNARVAELSDTQIQLDDAKLSIKHQEECHRDLHKNYQIRLQGKEQQFHTLNNTRECQIKAERTQLETTKHDLEQRLNVANSELEIQKRELLQGFDEAMVHKDHEYKLSLDEMSMKCLEQELKNQLLVKEMELLQASRTRDSEFIQQNEVSKKTIERQLKEREWEISDIKNTTDYQVDELKTEILRLKSQNEKLLSDFNKKRAETDRTITEKDTSIDRLKSTHEQKESKLQEELREINDKLEAADVKNRQLAWTNEDLVKEKEIVTEKYHNEMEDLKREWGRQMKELGQNNVDRDLELGNLRDKVDKLNDELVLRKQDISRYKSELSSALDRERDLERKCTQCEVEWRRRYEDAERIELSKSEELVERLTCARDMALANVKEKDRLLHERDKIISALRGGLPIDQIVMPSDTHHQEMSDLRGQNGELKKVITEMRCQMEGMSLKDNNKLEYDMNKADTADMNVKDNPVLASHLKSLNNLIGSLRTEKLELVAQIKKQQVRIDYFNTQIESLSKQPREKQVEVDQLRYELSALTRRSHAECESLRQRNRDLEVQVKESNKEAEQYHRDSLEKNEIVTDLENQLSSYKLDMASKIQPVNFGAQELLIKQLQDEISSLQSRRSNQPHTSHDPAIVKELRDKLRVAACHVIQLTRDKQQLIELGNKLRAQISDRDAKPITAQSPIKDININPYTTDINPYTDQQTKLSAMEQLQYNLTKRELHFAKLSPERPSKDTNKHNSYLDEYRYNEPVEPSKQQPNRYNPVLRSMSSSGLDGLDEVWQILDRSSPSILTSQSFTASNEDPIKLNAPKNYATRNNDHLTISGNRAVLKSQSRPKSTPQISTKSTKKVKPKVRNYNLRNDSTTK